MKIEIKNKDKTKETEFLLKVQEPDPIGEVEIISRSPAVVNIVSEKFEGQDLEMIPKFLRKMITKQVESKFKGWGFKVSAELIN